MNRRRFLKYAGSTAAVIGASALGLDYLLKPTPLIEQTFTSSTETISTTSVSTTSSASTTETSSSRELPSLDLGANDLGGYVFHDYSGNGMLDEGEPFVNDVEIVAQGYYATLKVKPQSGIYVFKDLPKYKSYKICPVHPENKFRFMWRSPEEVIETRIGYTIDTFRGKQRLDLALGEGFLTLPLRSNAHYTISGFYDWDPRVEHVKWWNGAVLVPGDTTPTRYRTGFDNHSGIDYSIEVGSPIVAPAPGTVRGRQIGPQGQLGVQIYHDSIDFWTFYNHLSRIDVQEGQRVSRGQKFAESGESGTTFPHLHFNTKWVDTDRSFGFFDFYRPIFPMGEESSGFWSLRSDTEGPVWRKYPREKNPNLLGYWTKDNDPQYAMT